MTGKNIAQRFKKNGSRRALFKARNSGKTIALLFVGAKTRDTRQFFSNSPTSAADGHTPTSILSTVLLLSDGIGFSATSNL